jgi:preprotein translocase subunit SecG
MLALIITLHIIVCVALILIVLLQTGKGTDMGSAFGGGSGSNTLLGSSGASTVLTKATTIVAVVFMITSFALTYMSGHEKQKSVIENIKPAKKVEQTKAETTNNETKNIKEKTNK